MLVCPAGKEHNFNTYNDTTSSSLGVPYDYGSMMHYSKNAFRNGTEPTIVTKIPAFSDVIGQRMEFSDSDLLKLNRLYNCSKQHGVYHAVLYKDQRKNSGYCRAVRSPTPVCVFVCVCVLAQGSTFLDSCDFERENICGMIQGQGDKTDWIRVSSAAGGPSTDYSNMGKCTGEKRRPLGIQIPFLCHRPYDTAVEETTEMEFES